MVVIEAIRDHEVALSEPIVGEYKGIAERSAHASYRDGVPATIGELERAATVVEPAGVAFGLRDPDDEAYLATAAAGGAFPITGNSRDFTEPRYGSVVILSPRAFLDRMTRQLETGAHPREDGNP